jgi:hypothetical protein
VFAPDQAGNVEYVLHGRFADHPLLNLVLEASLLNWEAAAQCRKAAEKEADPQKRESLRGTAEFMTQGITAVVQKLGNEMARAITAGKSHAFRELADLVDHATARKIIDRSRQLLQSGYWLLQKTCGVLQHLKS